MIGITHMTTEDLITLGYIVNPDEYARQMAEIDAELQASRLRALSSPETPETPETSEYYEEYIYE
jgi:hypothetical protein